MDERKQYVPEFTNIHHNKQDKFGIKPETIVEAAADKENDYKNTTDVPEEVVEGTINYKKAHDEHKPF